ncbi:MAG: hypothetical protein Q8P22_13395 [Chloroflexota bacterium]|nr:hypothetical protein [Chloroflexota bacterium]
MSKTQKVLVKLGRSEMRALLQGHPVREFRGNALGGDELQIEIRLTGFDLADGATWRWLKETRKKESDVHAAV